MAYTVNINSATSAQIDAQPYGLSKSATLTVTSSNAIQQTVSTINAGGWTQLSLGNIINPALITAWNDNTINSSSVITIATGSAGQNIIGFIPSGLPLEIPWSGSLGGLYAKITSGTDSTGSVQYYIQQG